MAVIKTTIEPNAAFTMFTGSGDEFSRRRDIPRGECSFSSQGQNITAAGAGDTQQLQWKCTLPVNFAYSLAEVTVEINAAADASNVWDNIGRAILVDGTPPNRGFLVPMLGISQGEGLTTAGHNKIYDFPTLPKTIISPANGDVAFFSFEVDQDNEQGAAGVLNAFARFYIYDIEQWHHYGVNRPTLTR